MKNIIIFSLIILAVGCQKPNLDQVVADTVPPPTPPGSNCSGVCITDIDGNVYHTIQIGTQTWMMENLRVTKYRDGSLIPNTPSTNTWNNLITGTWCYYNDNSQNNADYGKLYNWHAVNDSRGLAPAGWHIPTYTEWATLESYLGGNGTAGGKLKETGTSHWNSPNSGATNSSSFAALPGGLKQSSGACSYQKDFGFWWSTSVDGNNMVSALNLDASNAFSNCSYQSPKYLGLSVRCIKDYTSTSSSCSPLSPGIIKTVAGFANTTATNTPQTGNCTNPPDGSIATQYKSCVNGPIAVDASGNVYYVQFCLIRKIDALGIITTIAGTAPGYSGDNGPANLASLDQPTCLAFDNNGNLVFADGANCRIRRINMSTGIITTIAGNGVNTYFGNNINATSASLPASSIQGICFDAQNNLYFTDIVNHVVRQINSSTNIISLFAGLPGSSGISGDGGLATLATLNNPSSLAFYSGKVYIATNNAIRSVSAGTITGVLPQSGIYTMSADQSGNLFYHALDYKVYKVSLITLGAPVVVIGSGALGDSGDCGPSINANISVYRLVFSQSLNSILFTDGSRYKIRQAKL